LTDRAREERIEALFSAIYELSPAERNAELQSLEDADRAELEALIATHDSLTTRGDDFLQALDTGRARSLLEQSGPPGAPETIGRYTVVRPLARGGMGIVYLAHDPRLDRPVAIKLLPSYLSADPAAVRDLAEEARMASALDDPRIATVYEIGETTDGSVFIAMAYYDGETLRERISRGPITVSEAVELGTQLAEGIDAAHRGGIIHGDVKPENVVITKGGALKIVDFGVARMLREGLTSAEVLPGTAAYMSPEQTRGERLDGRTDVWSIGVVLHEMLAGKRPFGGEGDSLVDAIRHAAPPNLATVRPDVSSRLARVVARSLEKERDRRPGSAGALAVELRAAADRESDTSASAARARRGKWSGGRILAATGAAALVIVAAATVLERRGHGGASAAGNASPAIAVLPFEVHGEELGLWREGMVDLLSIVLAEGTELRAVDARTVLARWREAVDDRGEPDLEGALEIARRTGAGYAVTGSIVPVAQGLRLGARVHALPAGRELASVQVQGSADSLFALVDLLAIDILSATWQGEGQPRRRLDLTRTTTSSLPALKAFLDGERLLRQADYGGAVAGYERAVADDSTFAYALFHLGLAYGWLSDARRQDESYARALRHSARLPEPERLLLRAIGAGSTSDPASTIALLSDVTRRYPDNPEAWYFLGDRYFHDGEQVLAGREESERAFRRVVALDPGFAPAYIHLIQNAFSHRPDSARADSLMKAYRRLAPTSGSNLEQRLALDLAFGDPTTRNEAWAALDTLPLEVGWWLAEFYFDHPRFWAMRQTVLDRVHDRQTPIDEQSYHVRALALLDNALSRGRVRAATAHLDDPLLLAGSRATGSYRVYSATRPSSPPALDPALGWPRDVHLPTGLQSVLLFFYSGAYAADRERWDDHAAAVERLLEEGDRLLSDGDSASARFVRGMATALTGKGLWARGDPTGALPLLTEGQRLATWPVSPHREVVNESIRWWIGDLLLESGRPRDAASYFEASWNDPLAAERLGPIYERIGDPARARAAYALVVSAWKDADPELQPRVRAARTALARLEGSQPD